MNVVQRQNEEAARAQHQRQYQDKSQKPKPQRGTHARPLSVHIEWVVHVVTAAVFAVPERQMSDVKQELKQFSEKFVVSGVLLLIWNYIKIIVCIQNMVTHISSCVIYLLNMNVSFLLVRFQRTAFMYCLKV